MLPWAGLQCVIVVFPGHTHFLLIFFTVVMMMKSNKLHFFEGWCENAKSLNLGFGIWYYQLNWQPYHLSKHSGEPILFCIAK